MKRIYISYRREDSSESYGRILEKLLGYFGTEAVLRTDASYGERITSPSGSDYRTYVSSAMKQCAVMVLLIGPQWLGSGRTESWSLEHLDDPIRIEIEEALRANVPIVPTLVQQAIMPTSDQLPSSLSLLLEQDRHYSTSRQPESLLALVSRSGLRVRQDPDFGGDTQRLCEVIENLAGLEASNPRQAAHTVTRTLRTAILITSGILVLHAIALAVAASQTQLARFPAFVLPATWLAGVVVTSLVDWGIFFLAGYFTARRTGQEGLGIIASVAAYVISYLIGAAIFADIAWSNWQVLTAPYPTPYILVGAPDWLLAPLKLLMQPFLLTYAVLLLGIPIGLLASLGCGWLGGRTGVAVMEYFDARERAQRQSYVWGGAQQEAGSLRRLSVSILRRNTISRPIPNRVAPAGKIFISYRRDDSAVMCGAIYDRLVEVFGVNNVFKDVDMIPIGVNFARFIATTLDECVAQLIVIGPRWATIQSTQGTKRLNDPADLVRVEVEAGLRSGLTVIPVLVQDASLPRTEELPESLRPLTTLQPVAVRHAPDFDGDMRVLSQRLASVIWPTTARRGILDTFKSVRTLTGAIRFASLFWVSLFLVYGIALGVTFARWILLPDVANSAFAVDFLSVSPVSCVLLAALCAAHLGNITGSLRESFWLSMRAICVGSVALALTAQLYGFALLHSSFGDALLNSLYGQVAMEAPAAAFITTLGPALIVTILAAMLSSFARSGNLRRLLKRQPSALQILFRPEDINAATRITNGLVTYFGRVILPSGRWRLQPAVATTGIDTPTTEHTERALHRLAATLVLVGPSWASSHQAFSGATATEDPLHTRIETALGLNQPIIPILLTGASMPSPAHLPPRMREFTMINGAWVRDDPDYDGDLRRLIRVIERVTHLRQTQRAVETLLPLLLGIICSTTLLAGLDALAGLWLTNTASSQSQPTLIATGVVLTALDFAVYALTSALVTLHSNRRLNGALAALFGAALATLASADALHLAAGAKWSFTVYLTGGPDLASQILSQLTSYVIFTLPIHLFGGLLLGVLGAMYGSIAFNAYARRAQERRLYEMARVAVQSESLTEIASRSSRPASGRQTQPLAADLPTHASTPPALMDVAGMDISSPGRALQPGARSTLDASEAQSMAVNEASRREQLLAEMLAARERTRLRARVRLAAFGGLAAAIVLVAAFAGGQVYRTQANSVRVQGTAVAHLFDNETATAEVEWTYFAAKPGPNCDTGSGRGRWWGLYDPTNLITEYQGQLNYSMKSSCSSRSDATTVSTLIDNGYYDLPGVLALFRDTPYRPAYSIEADVTLAATSCAGIVTNGQNTSAGGMYTFEICSDASWHIILYHNTYDTQQLATGKAQLLATNHLTAIVHGGQRQFKINGQLVANLTDTFFTSTDYIGIDVSGKPVEPAKLYSAAFSNFKYVPLG